MKKTFALLAATALVAVPLTAAPLLALGKGGMAPDFATLDQNADGVITAEELAARHEARFADADANGDGQLTRDELAAAASKAEAERMQQGLDRMIARFDKNGDGVLSADEMPQGPGDRMMSRLDANNDGQIDAEEFAAMGPGAQKGHGGFPKKGPHGQGGHEGHGEGFWR